MKGLREHVSQLAQQAKKSRQTTNARDMARREKDLEHRHKMDLMRVRKKFGEEMHKDKVEANAKMRRAVEVLQARFKKKKHRVYSAAAQGDAYRAQQALQQRREEQQSRQQKQRKHAMHMARLDVSRTIRRKEMEQQRKLDKPERQQRRSAKQQRIREQKDKRREQHRRHQQQQHRDGGGGSSGGGSGNRHNGSGSNFHNKPSWLEQPRWSSNGTSSSSGSSGGNEYYAPYQQPRDNRRV